MRKITTLILALLAMTVGHAQMSSLLYNSKHIPQKNMMNPAYFCNSGFYLSLPNLNLNLESPLSFNDIFIVKPVDGQNITYINNEAILASLDAKNELGLDLNVGLLGFGFKTKHGFFSFSSQIRTNAQVGLPKDVLHFLVEGNIDENGQGRDLTLIDQDLLSFQTYAECGIGYGLNVNERLTVGARFKLLLGLANINTTNTHIDLSTDPNLNTLAVNMDYSVRMSAPIRLSVVGDTALDIAFVKEIPLNWGFATDLGAQYKITDKLTIAASILDLGRIHWTYRPTELHQKEGTGNITFGGLEWESMFKDGVYNDEFFNLLADSIVSELTQFELDTLASDYWDAVPWRMNLSATYDFNRVLSASLMYRGERNRFNYYQSLTAGFNINLWDWMEIMACNTVNNFNDWVNPGVGVSLSLFKSLQFYALFDHVSDMYLVDGKSFHFFFGINLMFGHERKPKKTTNADRYLIPQQHTNE